MAQWGNTDDAANSVLWGVSQLNKTANLNNQTLLFGNTTPNGFIQGRTDGQFALDGTEIAVTNGSILSYELTNAGSGYSANAAVTVGGNGTANATANTSSGKILAVNVVLPGNSYITTPTVTIAAPAAKTFNANSAVAVNGFITLSSNILSAGDKVTYAVAAGNTAITELVSGRTYAVQAANSTGVYLAQLGSATALTLTKGLTEAGHSLTGETAQATAIISGAKGAAHAGWVKRTVGSGGRAGRVQYEVLVAMNSFTSDSEDTVLKDV